MESANARVIGLFAILLASALPLACAHDTLIAPGGAAEHSAVASPHAALDTARLDDEWLAIEKRSPGFAGMYLDSSGGLVIAHTDPLALSSALTAVQQVQGDVPQLHAPQIALRRVRFSIAALANYRALVENKVGRSDLVWSDLDEVNNRVAFGVASAAAATEIASAVLAVGLPPEAVSASVVPQTHLVGDLNNYHDTLAAGFQLGFTSGGQSLHPWIPLHPLGNGSLHDDGWPLHATDGRG